MLRFFRHIRKTLMEQNKIRSYALYAIGEIALVMIGILLALQVNNWNEQRVIDQQVQTYTTSLYGDLKDNFEVVQTQIEFLTADSAMLTSQLERINAHPESKDTLIKIIRHEFISSFVPSGRLNDQTYQTLVNSGDIEYMDSWLQRELAKFDYFNDDYFESNSSSSAFYLEGLTSFLDQYTITFFESIKGPLQDELWKSVDPQDLMIRFNKLTGTKNVARYNILRRLRALEGQILKLLSYLEDEYPHVIDS